MPEPLPPNLKLLFVAKHRGLIWCTRIKLISATRREDTGAFKIEFDLEYFKLSTPFVTAQLLLIRGRLFLATQEPRIVGSCELCHGG